MQKPWLCSILKKWRETLDYVSCSSPHFFRAPAGSCVLSNKTEHSLGFSIYKTIKLNFLTNKASSFLPIYQAIVQ